MATREMSDEGLELLKQFENCRLKAYKDSVGILTIGYGHTGADVHDGLEIDQAKADELLADDVETTENGVDGMVEVDISDNQFDALVCFAYNVGLMALEGSTLLRKLNSEDFDGAALEFARWNKAKGKVIQGLVNRRAAERTLFEKS